MAVTTPISEERASWNRPAPWDITGVPQMWFGRRVPDGVLAINMMRGYNKDQLMVRWRVKGDPDIHEMPFETTDEGVMAALAAMKLTC